MSRSVMTRENTERKYNKAAEEETLVTVSIPEEEAVRVPKQVNPVIRELKLKRKRKKMKSSLLVKVVCIFLLGLIVVFRYASITEMGYEVSRSQKEYTSLVNENQRTEVNLSRSLNIKELIRLAEEMGLQKPEEYQITRISIRPADQTELLNTDLKEDNAEEIPWYTKVYQEIRRFFGFLN